MKISESNTCQTCGKEIESIQYTFLDFKVVVMLWNQIEQWIKRKTSKTIKLSKIDKIFGRQSTGKLINK